ISYGTDEPPLLTDPIMRLDSFINNKPMEALSYKLVPYENRNHNSVIPASLYDGLMFLYGKK
ncbi:MAG: hypothetical protein AB8H12_11880, partial [Lewinella sp.]